MSKEQTPITAEKYPRLYGWELKNENGVEMAILAAEKIRKLVEWCEKEDKRTQAKVLEALEREFNNTPYIKHYNNGIVYTIGSKYYETEVKPRYN